MDDFDYMDEKNVLDRGTFLAIIGFNGNNEKAFGNLIVFCNSGNMYYVSNNEAIKIKTVDNSLFKELTVIDLEESTGFDIDGYIYSFCESGIVYKNMYFEV